MENPFSIIEEKNSYGAESLDWKSIKNFSPDEFDDPEEPGSWRHMDPMSIIELNNLRKRAMVPIITHNKFGLRGCVCVRPDGHSEDSRHYVDNECDAIDWHFDTDADPRSQVMFVLKKSGFTGIGIYYDWKWKDGEPLSVGFHTDRRKRQQIWRRENGKYIYLLK